MKGEASWNILCFQHTFAMVNSVSVTNMRTPSLKFMD